MKKLLAASQFLLEWALICIGVLGSVLCLTTAFHFPLPPAVWGLVPGLALILGLLFRGKTGKYYALGTLALLLLTGLLFRRALMQSLLNVWGELVTNYAKGYDRFRDFLPREAPSRAAAGPALLLLAGVETWLCTLSVRLWRRTTPAALSLLPGILPCFVLTDTPPSLLPLLAVVFSILTQGLSQHVRRRNGGEQNKAICLAALLSAGLLVLLLSIFPEQKYTAPITWDELTQKMSNWSRKQDNRGNVNAGLAGNPGTVDLSALGALPNRPVPALYLTSEHSGYFYLRGASYTGFDGQTWSRETAPEWGTPALFPYLGRSGDFSLKIETVSRESVFYTTYQTTRLPEGATVSDFQLGNPEGLQSYTLRYLPATREVEENKAYARWVYSHCLELPDQTRQQVLDWWADHGFSGRNSDTEEYARQVAAVVSGVARYSRNPQRMPAGSAFCEWFLNDATEGYCVHFASVCTALLRALNVPARYASGYVCDAAANETVRVTNLQAHAWVEIWVGGRWVPIEPTPQDATEFTGELPGSNTPDESGSEASTEATEPPAPTRSSEPLPATTESGREATLPAEETEPGGPGQSGGAAAPVDLTPLWIALAALSLPALILLRRTLALRHFERRLTRSEGNERARLLYRRIVRLGKLGGGPPSEELEALAKKAAFSQHALSEEELQYLRQTLDRQADRLAHSGLRRRLWCKYVLAVI